MKQQQGSLWDQQAYLGNFRIIIVNAYEGFNLTSTGLPTLFGLPLVSAGNILADNLLTNDQTSRLLSGRCIRPQLHSMFYLPPSPPAHMLSAWDAHLVISFSDEAVYAVDSGKAWGLLYVSPSYSQSLIATSPVNIVDVFSNITNPAAFLAVFNRFGLFLFLFV